ncbi:MAG: amino acid ABC transporter substrate-binding protein, partial [Deltaproteobacteria bacterium]
FAKEYQQRFGYAPDYHAASAIADVEVYAKAIAAAGSLEPAKVRDAVAKVDFGSLYGKVKFQPNGQISLPQTVIQIQKGEVVEIFAEDFLGKPRYPLPPWAKR